MLSGRVCLVTGATRGIGKGIALQLGSAGAIVYITGRTLKPKGDSIGGCLEDTANEVNKRGGSCVPVVCDHSKDEDVKKLFDQIEKEQNGRLDLLVNNAYAAVTAIADSFGKTFWETDPQIWDTVNNVGLRNHYYCSVYAARLMAPRKDGLIVNISSIGGLRYVFNVSYGIGKEACDRMAADCAMELKSMNVTYVSLWPGLVSTEHMQDFMENREIGKRVKGMHAESPEFTGKAIVHLMMDKDKLKKTGKTLIVADMANEYQFKDIDGQQPPSMRQLNVILAASKRTWLAALVPDFVKLPGWLISLGGCRL